MYNSYVYLVAAYREAVYFPFTQTKYKVVLNVSNVEIQPDECRTEFLKPAKDF